MKQVLRYRLVVAIALLALGGMGCGGSGGAETGADGSVVPKAVYIEKGDSICQANYEKRTQLLLQLRKTFSEGKNLPSPSRQEAILVNQIMPIFWEESRELNALPPPKEGAEEADQILSALEQSIERVEADPAKSLSKGTGVEFEEAERLAHEYGFEWCGRS